MPIVHNSSVNFFLNKRLLTYKCDGSGTSHPRTYVLKLEINTFRKIQVTCTTKKVQCPRFSLDKTNAMKGSVEAYVKFNNVRLPI